MNQQELTGGRRGTRALPWPRLVASAEVVDVLLDLACSCWRWSRSSNCSTSRPPPRPGSKPQPVGTSVRMADEVSSRVRAPQAPSAARGVARRHRRRARGRRGAGVFVSSGARTPTQAAPKPPSTRTRGRPDGTPTYAPALAASAGTKGGDLAVYASPDPNARPTTR